MPLSGQKLEMDAKTRRTLSWSTKRFLVLLQVEGGTLGMPHIFVALLWPLGYLQVLHRINTMV